MSDQPRYRVEVPFEPLSSSELQPPIDLGDGTEVIKADGGYRFCVTVRAPDASAAWVRAREVLGDFLTAFAVCNWSFVLVAGGLRDATVKRLDPPADPVPDSELPFDTVGGVVPDEGRALMAQLIGDPDGAKRRAGMVLKLGGEGTLVSTDPRREVELFARRAQWPDQARRAAAIYYLASQARDPDVRFLLAYLAFETLVAHEAGAIVRRRLASRTERRLLEADLESVLARYGLDPSEIGRVMARVRDTETQGFTDSARAYSEQVGTPMELDELRWLASQRGKFVHAGQLDADPAAQQRRQAFISYVGEAIRAELAGDNG